MKSWAEVAANGLSHRTGNRAIPKMMDRVRGMGAARAAFRGASAGSSWEAIIHQAPKSFFVGVVPRHAPKAAEGEEDGIGIGAADGSSKLSEFFAAAAVCVGQQQTCALPHRERQTRPKAGPAQP